MDKFLVAVKIILASIVFIIIIISNNLVISAKTTEELEQEIKELEAKINEKQEEADSLSNAISLLDNNIALKNAQINKANNDLSIKEQELDIVSNDIGLLTVRIERVGENISKQKEIIALKLKEMYMSSQVNIFSKLTSIINFSDILLKDNYLEISKSKNNEQISLLNETKVEYADKQTILKEKQDELEQIKQSIERQRNEIISLKNELDGQKDQKEDLLKVTQNDEAKYQAELNAARRELSQIQQAAETVIRSGSGTKVEKGEVIGTMGNSGFSTGVHLHFSIYEYTRSQFENAGNWGWYYRNYINPEKKLESKQVFWDTGCRYNPSGWTNSGDGDWQWPVDNVRVTQGYGSNTCYNWLYGGKPHPALDMARPYIDGVRQQNVPVKAIADGEAYFCRNCLGDGGNGVFIFHDEGYMSVYWHLK